MNWERKKNGWPSDSKFLYTLWFIRVALLWAKNLTIKDIIGTYWLAQSNEPQSVRFALSHAV